MVIAQCSNYTVTVGGGTWDAEITWDIVDENGVTQALGAAPFTGVYCLNPGCFTINMYDTFGDGWNGAFMTITDAGGFVVFSSTMANGTFATEDVALGGGFCVTPPCDYTNYTMTVAGGTWEAEISWTLTDDQGTALGNGLAPSVVDFCLEDGCYTILMYDSFGDGWNGGTWTLSDDLGTVMGTGTLGAGAYGEGAISVNGIDCLPDVVTASDCHDAVDVCSDTDFMIDPNGFGTVMEIPAVGTVSNPSYDALNPSPWGGGNMGCLLGQELNSTWMIINISEGGILEFTFGGLGTQSGFYDWALWPFSETACADIFLSTLPPVRCNWNISSAGGTGCCVFVPAGGDPGNYEPAMTVATGDQYLVCFSNWSSVTNNVPLEFYGTAVVSCEPILLPIELNSFVARPQNRSVKLEWSTASETNNEFFTVERSIDMEHWVKIGEVLGAGTSIEENNYQLLDRSPLYGTSYYRLKQTDVSGYSMHSQSVSVHLELPNKISVWPNPNKGKFSLSLKDFELKKGNISIINQIGAEIAFSLHRSSKDILELEMDEIISGVYFIRIIDNAGVVIVNEKLRVD